MENYKKHATSVWELEMDDELDLTSQCYLYGDLVIVKTEGKELRYCFLDKDVKEGVSLEEHNLFVTNYSEEYTDYFGSEYDQHAQPYDDYWLRAGKHTELKFNIE
jgi:hypothetical protein